MDESHATLSPLMPDSDSVRGLSDAQIQQFILDGFVRIEPAFPRDLADQGRSILWRDTGCDEGDPRTWTKPVIRLGMYGQAPFARAANTPVLHKAFDQLVGPGRWRPRTDLGTFPIRFPSPKDPGDAGWHIDTSFPPETGDPSDFFDWHVNVTSKGRALLMLFLFSDVGENDAPTRIRVSSHLDVARMLAAAGESGRSLRELAANGFAETVARRHDIGVTQDIVGARDVVPSHGFRVGHQFVGQIADPFEASGFDENPVMRNDVRIREGQLDMFTGANRELPGFER